MERREFFRNTLGATLGAAIGSLAGSSLLEAQSVRTGGAFAAQGSGATRAAAQGSLPSMTVYKSATCGCCSQWVEHAKEAGFAVKTIDTNDLAAVKRNMGVPARLQSCHTVLVGSYVVEGHVPAADVKRLLSEKPKVRGLAVPGMPVGSPGMEQGSPANYDRYDVISFTADGTQAVFATHGPPRQ
ncbi:MAG TPA: DUF411 domain-containing protein [Gemmatimonadaceae bacterium]|nr:DUF411 domain-containing protein [Gemmatimonadaceae bacterium]